MKYVFGSDLTRGQGLAAIDANFQLYCECFPDPDERETKEKLKLLYLRIVGWDFAQLFEGERLLGVCHFCRVNAESAFIEHLYIRPEFRLNGHGRKLLSVVEQALAIQGIKYLFAEMNDHNLMTKEEISADNLDPVERYQFWTKLGYRTVNAPYRQPPLVDFVPSAEERVLLEIYQGFEEGSGESVPETVDYLSIIAKVAGRTVPATVYKEAVSGYFRTFLPAERMPELDPCYVEISELIDGHTELELLPLGARRTICQTRR